MIGKIVGKEIRTYTKDTEVKTARTVYVVWDKPKNPTDGFEGQRCESVYVPFEIPPKCLVGTFCDFIYAIFPGRNGSVARLVDIVPKS